VATWCCSKFSTGELSQWLHHDEITINIIQGIISIVLPLPKEGGCFYLYLSVCLSARLLKKSYEGILMKFFGGKGRGQGTID